MYLRLPAYVSPWVGRLSSGPRLHPLPPRHRAHVCPFGPASRVGTAVLSRPFAQRAAHLVRVSILDLVNGGLGTTRPTQGIEKAEHALPKPSRAMSNRSHQLINPSTFPPYPRTKPQEPRTKNKEPLPTPTPTPFPCLRLPPPLTSPSGGGAPRPGPSQAFRYQGRRWKARARRSG